MFIIYVFKDNKELLNDFKNSNVVFYKKIPVIIDNFNDFLNNNEKTISEQNFVDFYIDCLNFLKLKIIDSTNNINKYITNHPDIIDEEGNDNYNDNNFENLNDIRYKYADTLDNLIVLSKNNYFNFIIDKYDLYKKLPFYTLISSLQSHFKNKKLF